MRCEEGERKRAVRRAEAAAARGSWPGEVEGGGRAGGLCFWEARSGVGYPVVCGAGEDYAGAYKDSTVGRRHATGAADSASGAVEGKGEGEVEVSTRHSTWCESPAW